MKTLRKSQNIWAQRIVLNDVPQKVMETFGKDGIKTMTHLEEYLKQEGNWGDIGKFDVIFIRNVLIYQNVENKKKVIEGIYSRLNPKGFLILGAAESLYGISEKFKQIAVDKAIIYQRD